MKKEDIFTHIEKFLHKRYRRKFNHSVIERFVFFTDGSYGFSFPMSILRIDSVNRLDRTLNKWFEFEDEELSDLGSYEFDSQGKLTEIGELPLRYLSTGDEGR